MKKKIGLMIIAVLVLAAGVMLAGTGGKRMDVMLTGYTVSGDGGAGYSARCGERPKALPLEA